jgi:RNA 3'-terminal phosphate cyclase
MKKRIIFIFLIALTLTLAWACDAQAFTVSGGTAAQRAIITEAINASWVPVAEVEAGVRGIEIEIADHYPPYWEIPPGTFVDVLHGAVGLAWPGHK